MREPAVIGYAVYRNPGLASYRLRVALPAEHLGMPYAIGAQGDVTFFYKDGNPVLAARCPRVVYDVVNDHFDRPDVRAMADIADVLTCGSQVMAERVREACGRDATVIDDPYETDEHEPLVAGHGVLWVGHSANLPSLLRYAIPERTIVCSNHPGTVPWSLRAEADLMDATAVVLVTGTNPGASSNRVVKAIRAGRFVVVPKDCAESWRQFADYIWIGDIGNGIAWALNNREEACRKIKAGQEYVRERFSPKAIGSQWGSLFASILAAGRSARKGGPALTSP